MKKYCIFHNNDILLKTECDGSCHLPHDAQLMKSIPPSADAMTVEMPDDDTQYITYPTLVSHLPDSTYQWCDLRGSYYKLSATAYKTAGKCKELNHWNENTHYCGRCGSTMEFSSSISKKCTGCGHEVWPLLATAIIVLIHKGDQVLLVHARNFKRDFYGCVAGFVETGETLEEAVRREVKEETGIAIKNIRYFSSQPWPFPCGLMIGFNADYDAGEIKLQEEELEFGNWFGKDNLPNLPEKLSIARQLIDHWLDEQ